MKNIRKTLLIAAITGALTSVPTVTAAAAAQDPVVTASSRPAAAGPVALGAPNPVAAKVVSVPWEATVQPWCWWVKPSHCP
ncbi:hypothetical protein [Mycobacterium botniense]|uniref:hypothetical protein n=1 Tax=Mycobacterium botniense TaxID=84962 RepID=UPI0013D32879|nr:hypothetical protein [Mycobacterium botniense]